MFLLWLIPLLLALVLGICYYCFRTAFYVPKKTPKDIAEYPIPIGRIYEPYHAQMKRWMEEARATPHEKFTIQSHDGLTLHGTYYEYAPNAPIEIMFHGYRGSGERDLCGGIQRCFVLGHSALIVNQRASAPSEGNVISFGANEHKDCLAWVDFAVQHFGTDAKIILTGISMGAATVLLAAGKELPANVVGVLADCGYSSAEEIIKIVIRSMKLPPKLAYPFVKLSARIFGHFNLDQADVTKAVKNCKVPVIFFHGQDDDFVPYHMSQANFDACPSTKRLVITPGAGHGLSYLVDPDGYVQAVREFFDPILNQETEHCE